MRFILTGIVLLFVMQSTVFGQRYGKNIPTFEYRKWHFGANLGGTSTRYIYQLRPNFVQYDSVYQVNVNSGPGFAIHLPVVSWNIHSTVHLRTIPSLSFHETTFDYSFWREGESETVSTRTQPTLLNFPLLLKVNTKRITNFSAYGLTGFSYSLDLASNEKVDQLGGSESVLKLKKHDFAYHVGGGFDFYLEYFKFGIEIKLTNGVRNLLIQDDTFFSSPLESLKSQIWWFSITFEG